MEAGWGRCWRRRSAPPRQRRSASWTRHRRWPCPRSSDFDSATVRHPRVPICPREGSASDPRSTTSPTAPGPIRKRPEQNGIQDAEHCGVGANRQRQCGCRGRRKSGTLAESPGRVAEILARLVEPCRDPDAPRVLLCERDVAKREHRLTPRLLGRHAHLDVVLGFALDVIANVLVEAVPALAFSSGAERFSRLMGFTPECAGRRMRADRPSQPVPLARLDLELSTALGGQVVELGAPVVLRRALIERNPATLDQAVQRRIQRPLLDLQHMSEPRSIALAIAWP